MSTEREKLFRLLNMYPNAKLRESFEIRGSAKRDMVHDIVDSHDQLDVFDFCQHNLPLCKQHVFCFELSGDIGRLPETIITDYGTYDTFSDTKEREWFYFLNLSYDVILEETAEQLTIEFFWPVLIRATSNNKMFVHFVIMQKNIRSYLSTTGRVFTRSVNLTEEDVLQIVENVLFENNIQLVRLDLNRGVKDLWEKNIIDCTGVKYRNSKSFASEIMDEDSLLKIEYPDLYNQLMSRPLSKSSFRAVGETKIRFPGEFTIDPSMGTLFFTRFPETHDQVNNVISEIIGNN